MPSHLNSSHLKPKSQPNHPPIPPSFRLKKSQILASLSQSVETYTDKSPKGTVDAHIEDLIAKINAYEGLVTTSSCAGRVAVFVEGPKGKGIAGEREEGREGDAENQQGSEDDGEDEGHVTEEGGGDGETNQAVKRLASSVERNQNARIAMKGRSATTTSLTSPGGKGGGRWLYVSHDPIPMPSTSIPARAKDSIDPASRTQAQPLQDSYFSTLFNLPTTVPSTKDNPTTAKTDANPSDKPPVPRLVHLSFSPLILHIHCASLHHARPVLSAAINAGFRESGVQSLRSLDAEEANKGVMVAVRTAGLSFETVVGKVVHREQVKIGIDGSGGGGGNRNGEGEAGAVGVPQQANIIQTIVSEEYLALCAGVVNERFRWNDERRERFRRELQSAMEREGLSPTTEGDNENGQWEDREQRKRRKREEGLARQLAKSHVAKEEIATAVQTGEPAAEDLDEDLSMLELG